MPLALNPCGQAWWSCDAHSGGRPARAWSWLAAGGCRPQILQVCVGQRGAYCQFAKLLTFVVLTIPLPPHPALCPSLHLSLSLSLSLSCFLHTASTKPWRKSLITCSHMCRRWPAQQSGGDSTICSNALCIAPLCGLSRRRYASVADTFTACNKASL